MLKIRTAAVAVFLATVALSASATAAAAAPTTPRPAVATVASGISEIVGCNSGTGSWFHLYYYTNGQQSETCVGGAGSLGPNSAIVGLYDAFCGGNNYGYLKGYAYDPADSSYDIPITQDFGPGTSLYVFGDSAKFNYSDFFVTDVTITKWSGSDTCPN